MPDVAPELLECFAANTTRLLRRFALWDTNHDGTVSWPEFERACESLDVPGGARADDVRQLFEALDVDLNGEVQIEEVVRFRACAARGSPRTST